MKKIFLIFSILTFGVRVSNVDAATTSFTNGDRKYSLEIAEVECADGMLFDSLDQNNNFIFYSDNTEKYYKLTENKKCEVVSDQEYLNLLNRDFKYDYLEQDASGNYQIVRRTTEGVKIERYIKTEDTASVDGKEYFEIFDANSMGSAIPTGDMSKYYEKIYVAYPTSTTIQNITYYKADGNFAVVKVDDPKSEDILSYYVDVTEDVKETKKVMLTLDSKFKTIIGNQHAEVVKSSTDDTYYVIIIDEDSMLSGDKFSIDVYNLKGELLFEDINWIFPYEDLFIVIDDNQTYFYNSAKKLLHKEAMELYDVSYDKTSKTLYGVGNNEDVTLTLKLNYTKVESTLPKVDEKNPQTSDNILSSFIILGVSLLGLIIGVISLRKNRKNA